MYIIQTCNHSTAQIEIEIQTLDYKNGPLVFTGLRLIAGHLTKPPAFNRFPCYKFQPGDTLNARSDGKPRKLVPGVIPTMKKVYLCD